MIGAIRKHQLGGEPSAPKKKRVYQESDDQRAVVAWLRARPNWLVMRLENAAKRTPAQAARDKAMGMEPGAPDLVVMLHTFGFYLEMKKADGRVSDEQENLHAQLRARGMCVLVGWGEARTIVALKRLEEAWSYYEPCPRVLRSGVLKTLIENASVK